MNKSRILFVGNHFRTKRVWEEIPERLNDIGYSAITTSSSKSRALRMIDMVLTTLKTKNHYDLAIIDVFSGLSFIWAELVTLLLKLLNKPYILVLRGGGLPEFANHNPDRISKLLRSATFVITASRWMVSTFSSLRSDIQYLPNGIDINQYPFRSRTILTPRLCWMRSFHSIYQPWMAVEAFKIVYRSFPSASLLMIGPDKKDGSLEKTKEVVHKNRLGDSVFFLGGISKTDVPNCLNRADIFVNTTLFESFGVSVIEAAACGLPIVTTNIGELPYLWEDGEDALLVPPNDPDAMAAAVMRILAEPGLAEKLSTNARIKVEQFDWSVILPQWEALLEEICTHG